MIKLIGLTKKFLYSQDSHHVIFENSEDITDFISRIYFRSQKTEKLGIEDDVSFGTLIEFMHVELQLEKSIRNRDGTSYDDIQSIIDDIERLNKKDLKSIFMIVTKYLLFKKGVRDLRNCRWTFGLYMIIQFIKSFFIWCVEKCVDAFILTKDLGRNLKHSLFGSARDSDVIDKNDHSLGIGNST